MVVGQLNKFTFIFLVFFYSLELNAIEFKGKFEQGSFILGKTEPGSQVVIDKKDKGVKRWFFCFWFGTR